jgi:hypothetical protein
MVNSFGLAAASCPDFYPPSGYPRRIALRIENLGPASQNQNNEAGTQSGRTNSVKNGTL